MSCWAQSCQDVFQVIRAQVWVESTATGAVVWVSPFKSSCNLLGKGLDSLGCQSLAQSGGDKAGPWTCQGLGEFINHTVRPMDGKEKSQPVTIGVRVWAS